jgi:hypothetical protein
MFPIMACVSKDERRHIDMAIRAAAWVLMSLAFYQKFSLGDPSPASALAASSVYAGAVLMLLPLALETRDWLLAVGLGITLLWTQSLGAWFGLSVALMLSQIWRRGAWSSAGLVSLLVCLVVFYGSLQTPAFLNRVAWWRGAGAMIYEQPLFGFGPDSFSILSEGAQYPHQYFLQTTAEYGVLFAIIWFGGLWVCLGRGSSYKRFGAIAVLAQSFWDWSLSMPAILWLFAYFSSSSLSEEPRGVNIPSRYRPAFCVLIFAMGGFLCVQVWDLWVLDRAPHFEKARKSMESVREKVRGSGRRGI